MTSAAHAPVVWFVVLLGECVSIVTKICMRLYYGMNQWHSDIRRVRIGDALTLHVRSYDHLQIVDVNDFINKQFSESAN